MVVWLEGDKSKEFWDDFEGLKGSVEYTDDWASRRESS
jgi:hypothetical protein